MRRLPSPSFGRSIVLVAACLTGGAAACGASSGGEVSSPETTATASAAVAAPSASAAPVAAPSASAFADLVPEYMAALDDKGSDVEARAIAMEKKLAPLADHALEATAPNEDAGRVLIYAALLLERNDSYLADGRIKAAELLGPGDAKDAQAQRRHRAAKLLKKARELRPSDGRIASWLAGAEARDEVTADGKPSAASKQKLIDAIDVEPEFNLWTALIALREEPAASPTSSAVFDKVEAFIASKRCRDVKPGSVEERNCKSGPLAPFNRQAAVVMLGDVYLKRGEDLLRKGNIPGAMPLLGKARGIYATLDEDAVKDATAAWSRKDAFAERKQRLGLLLPGKKLPADDFFGSKSYLSVYDCSSCHVGSK